MDQIELLQPSRDVFLQARSAENPGLYDDEDMSGEEILAAVQRAKLALQLVSMMDQTKDLKVVGMAMIEISRLEQQLRREVGVQVYDMAELHSLCERRDQKILKQAQEYAEINEEPLAMVEQHGTWAVTESGVEYLFRDHYRIDKEDLLDEMWPIHMSEKNWVGMSDFVHAFYAARRYHHPDKFKSGYPR